MKSDQEQINEFLFWLALLVIFIVVSLLSAFDIISFAK